MLQSFCKVDEWLPHSFGERSPKVTRGTCIHSLQSSLLKHKEENEREKDFNFRGKGRFFRLMFGYESETAKHLFVSKIYVIAAQSFPFKVQTAFFL